MSEKLKISVQTEGIGKVLRIIVYRSLYDWSGKEGQWGARVIDIQGRTLFNFGRWVFDKEWVIAKHSEWVRLLGLEPVIIEDLEGFDHWDPFNYVPDKVITHDKGKRHFYL